jgi:hypothetical protein
MGTYNPNTNFLYDELTQKVQSVSSGSAVELFTGASRNPDRQVIRIYNDGNRTVYLGPATVTSSGPTKGEPLESGEAISYPGGDSQLYAITNSGTTSLIITELA